MKEGPCCNVTTESHKEQLILHSFYIEGVFNEDLALS